MSPVLALKMGHRSRAIDFVEWDAMKSTPIRFVVAISLALLFAGLAVRAQDSHFSPNDQQIPAPDCLSAAKDLWIAGVRLCTPADHEAWLAVGAVQFHPAADDGAGSLLLRSCRGQVHRRPLSRRSRKALRRDRLGADLANVAAGGSHVSHVALRSLRQPLAKGEANSVDRRE
jgi:hypothetical protein